MQARIITIFPAMFDALMDCGISRRAFDDGLIDIRLFNLRDYGQGSHRVLDDRPYGGGPGMVMLAEPVIECVNDAKAGLTKVPKVVYLSPQGRRLEHSDVCSFAQLPSLVLLCGRYEGVDQRALDIIGAEEWSIGDYILSGGELAAMVLLDAVIRQLPGALGNEQSRQEDSFTNGLLDCIHYTRPHSVMDLSVPDVLKSGNHEQIRRWRLKQSVGRTWLRRPDLLEKVSLSDEQLELLDEFQNELNNSGN